jgi:hypothetical protein
LVYGHINLLGLFILLQGIIITAHFRVKPPDSLLRNIGYL